MSKPRSWSFKETPQDILEDVQRLHKGDIEDLETLLESYKNIESCIQQELDRRALAGFWAAHPNLLRLEVGNKLLVTEEFLSLRDMRPYWKDEVIVILGWFDLGAKGEYIFIKDTATPASQGVGGIPISLACNMRQAYLAQQGETT